MMRPRQHDNKIQHINNICNQTTNKERHPHKNYPLVENDKNNKLQQWNRHEYDTDRYK